MLNPYNDQLTIPAELLGLNDIRVLAVNTDLKTKTITIKVEVFYHITQLLATVAYFELGLL